MSSRAIKMAKFKPDNYIGPIRNRPEPIQKDAERRLKEGRKKNA